MDRFVALKTLQAGLADDLEYIARFRQEARAAAGLNHPNLVQVFSAGDNEGLHWFAMEYVEGESAKIRLKRKGRLDSLEAIAIAIHVATALEYGWQKAKLIHRDVKPDNIFLSEDGEVKLGDLGLAKSAGQTQGLTMTGASMGTPRYISPEQVLAMKTVDLRTDIYSLGCTLFHLLSGKAPFEGNSAVAIMMKHVHEPVPNLLEAWPECPQVAADVVGKMMQKDPGERQQEYGDVITALRRAYDGAGRLDVEEIIVKKKPASSKAAQPALSQIIAPTKAKQRAYAGIGIGVLATAIAAFLHFKPRPQAQGGGASATAFVAAATKDSPFVNSLGMKFVPVAVVGGPTEGRHLLFSIWDTRVQNYDMFTRDTKHAWPKADFDQTPTHPAANVSWDDTKAFCQWITDREHKCGKLPSTAIYRLPTDHEWSCAVGIGAREHPPTIPKDKNGKIEDLFEWGELWPPPPGAGNFAGEELRAELVAGKYPFIKSVIDGYSDAFLNTSPVASFSPNPFGLYDMEGNVRQWCEDTYFQDQTDRVLRGASWIIYDRRGFLLSLRNHHAPNDRNYECGFRCVLDLTAN